MIATPGALCGVLTLLLAPPFALLAAVTAAALWRAVPVRPPSPPPPGGGPRFVVVIPAHDEQEGVAATVASCRAAAAAYDPARAAVVVLADNCTDRTAEAARAAGALVWERHDPSRRSKGFALEDFFAGGAAEVLGDVAYDAAVVIDADTLVDPGMLASFAAGLAGGSDWMQGYYTASNPEASWRTRLLTLGFALANGSWPLGMTRLGHSAALRGNGMCLASRGLRRVPWAASGLAEDLEFSWTLRQAGQRVDFEPTAVVRGAMVSRGGAAAASQRRRWEAGRAELRARVLVPLLRAPGLGAGAKLMGALELFFPPLVRLLLGLGLAAAVHPAATAAAAGGWGGAGPLADWSRLLAPAHALMLATLAAYVLSPTAALGLPARLLRGLPALPLYAVWKTAVALRGRPTSWVRTAREAPVPPAPPGAGPP